MKKILLVVCLVLIPTLLWAAPFLVCDPYPAGEPQPTYFLVSIDGGNEANIPATTITGGVILHQDVGGISVGVHSWTVKACMPLDPFGSGGCSVSSPFSYTRQPPGNVLGAPTGTRLSAQ